jgi:formate dehydrogenase iron-sulfur subunit
MKAILTDVTRCIGCEDCVTACNQTHGHDRDIRFRWTAADGLSGERFTSVRRHRGAFVRQQCRHCHDPACASACPVKALAQTDEGAVVYDEGRCLGCRYCMMACPFGIPRYSWESPAPLVRKCTMCYEERVSQGQQPACTEACQAQATIFGNRDALVREAHQRIRAEPGKYHREVIGEEIVGGTNVLYLAPFDLDFLNVGGELDSRPWPARTAPAMAAVPPAFLGMGAIMGGLYWIIDRRMKQQGGAGPNEADAQPQDQPDDQDSDEAKG